MKRRYQPCGDGGQRALHCAGLRACLSTERKEPECRSRRQRELQAVRVQEHLGAHSLSRVRLSATPCTADHQLLCPWGFSRQEYRSGLPFPPPGDLPNSGIEPRFPAFQVDPLPSEPPGKTPLGTPISCRWENEVPHTLSEHDSYPCT